MKSVGGEISSSPTVFSVDSKHFICGFGRTVKVFSAVTGSLVRVIHGHKGLVTGLVLNHQTPSILYTCSQDGSLRSFNWETGNQIEKRSLGRPIYALASALDQPAVMICYLLRAPAANQSAEQAGKNSVSKAQRPEGGHWAEEAEDGEGEGNVRGGKEKAEDVRKMGAVVEVDMSESEARSKPKSELESESKPKLESESEAAAAAGEGDSEGDQVTPWRNGQLTWKILFRFRPPGWEQPKGMAVSADGRYVAIAGGMEVSIWDRRRGHLSSLLFLEDVTCVAVRSRPSLGDDAHVASRDATRTNGNSDDEPAVTDDMVVVACGKADGEICVTSLPPDSFSIPAGPEIISPQAKSVPVAGSAHQRRAEVRKALKERWVRPRSNRLHWHCTPVRALVYSTEGGHILSGGDEGVLVEWQVATGQRRFLARLGARILAVSESRDGSLVGVTLADNSVQLIVTSEWKAEVLVRGVPRSGGRHVFASEPRNGLVAIGDGRLGQLHLYDCLSDRHVSIIEAGQVVASGAQALGIEHVKRKVALANQKAGSSVTVAVVSHVAWSADGRRMATLDHVEGPEVGVGAEASQRLQFWRYEAEPSRYVLQALLENPHERLATDLRYSPCGNVVVTTSLDGSFATWTLVEATSGEPTNAPGNEHNHNDDDEASQRPNARTGHSDKVGQKKPKQGNGTVAAMKPGMLSPDTWRCSSVSYYRDYPAHCASFSPDGSTVAVGSGQLVTLWDVATQTLRSVLTNNAPGYPVTRMSFAGPSGEHLVAATDDDVTCWSVITGMAQYCIQVHVTALTADSAFEQYAVASDGSVSQREGGCILLFSPVTSPVPARVFVTHEAVVGLAFPLPVLGLEVTPAGVILALLNDDTIVTYGQGKTLTRRGSARNRSLRVTPSTFEAMFGQLSTRERDVTGATPLGRRGAGVTSRVTEGLALFNVASHALSSVSTLCSPFLTSLLRPPAEKNTHTPRTGPRKSKRHSQSASAKRSGDSAGSASELSDASSHESSSGDLDKRKTPDPEGLKGRGAVSHPSVGPVLTGNGFSTPRGLEGLANRARDSQVECELEDIQNEQVAARYAWAVLR